MCAATYVCEAQNAWMTRQNSNMSSETFYTIEARTTAALVERDREDESLHSAKETTKASGSSLLRRWPVCRRDPAIPDAGTAGRIHVGEELARSWRPPRCR